MSHPDPMFDYDNSYEDDMDYNSLNEGWNEEYGHGNYDDLDDFYGESCDYSDYNDSMDGDFDSAMTSAGFGTDEDYGYYGDPENDNDYGYEDFQESGEDW